MERFYNNEEPPDDDFDDEDGDEAPHNAYIHHQGIMDVMHAELAETDLNQQILGRAIAIAEKSWRWRFLTTNKKLSIITDIYEYLVVLTSIDRDEDE